MHKAILYCLILLFITNGKALELGKIPILIEHFQQHKAQRAELSFNEFLFMHYIGDDANDQDNSSDEQLPFKHSDESSGVSIDGIWLPDNSIVFDHTIDMISETDIPECESHLLTKFNSQLFRPPVLS